MPVWVVTSILPTPPNTRLQCRIFSLRWADLQAAGVHFIPADIDSYSGTWYTIPPFSGSLPLRCWRPMLRLGTIHPPPINHALWAHPLTPTQQQTFLFVDDVHLTTAGQTIEADYEYSLLIAPSQISLLVESAVQNGLARAATIQRQIDLSWQHRGPNGTKSGPAPGRIACASKTRAFPMFPASPSAARWAWIIGRACGLILGAAFTAGSQTQKFSTGGHFNQVDEAPSLYAAYKAGSVWGNVVATYGLFQNKIYAPSAARHLHRPEQRQHRPDIL